MKKEKNLVQQSEVVYEVVGGNHAKNQIKQEIQYISLENLKEFKNHPFKVEDDMELFELMKSIKTEGVLVPILARPHPEGEGYEIVSGHRRKAAAMKAGFTEVPVIVRQMSDDEAVINKMADKIARLRIFEDENGKMNLNLEQVSGAILSISQFTLYADCRKGNRPSFSKAGRPDHAKKMYLYFNDVMRRYGFDVQEGIFGADMKVRLLNDGPVTIVLDSDTL